MPVDLSDYVDVPTRIRHFRQEYPEGTLQSLRDPYLIKVGEQSFLVYQAAAYRSPDDPRPGHGCAWEPVPGRTPYTRDSELQNAETSAWGRAIIAVGAADASVVASRDEVAARQPSVTDRRRDELLARITALGSPAELKASARAKRLPSLHGTVTDNDMDHWEALMDAWLEQQR